MPFHVQMREEGQVFCQTIRETVKREKTLRDAGLSAGSLPLRSFAVCCIAPGGISSTLQLPVQLFYNR